MAGMKGFYHDCESVNEEISAHKKSIEESTYTPEEKLIIWDFYVTHNLVGDCGLQIKLQDYGWDMSSNKRERTLAQIEKDLMIIAHIDKMCCIRAKTIKDTLNDSRLSGFHICIEHPRIVLLQKYSIKIDENENISFAGGNENRIDCLFRHIRNSLAHSNTYFFENGNILLEDKDGSTITARMLINKQTLIDWIMYIDKNHILSFPK